MNLEAQLRRNVTEQYRQGYGDTCSIINNFVQQAVFRRKKIVFIAAERQLTIEHTDKLSETLFLTCMLI